MYEVVYDVRTAGLDLGWIAAPALFCLAMGFLLVVFRNRIFSVGRWQMFRSFPYVYVAGVLVVTAAICGMEYWAKERLRRTLESGQFSTVEGIVTDFRTSGSPGNQWEAFAVNGKRFEYSERRGGSGFRRTREQGGPIQPGLQVRIAFVTLGNDEILRVEVERGTSGVR